MSTRQGNTLHAPEINAALQRTRLGGHVMHLPVVGSTNDLALAAAQEGVPCGVWVADAQTAGRGRGGHGWHSQPGDGLYVSALFTPRLPATPNVNAQLSLLAGLAAWEAIREVTGITADIRWPNDLMTRPQGSDRSRKLGGVLVETAIGAAAQGEAVPMLRYAVVGIGLNVAHARFAPELAEQASSLYLEGWQYPDRQPLLIALLEHLDGFLQAAERSQTGFDPGAHLFAASTWLRGKRVHVPEEGGYTGVTAGLDSQGFLLVQDDTGKQRTVRSGGVREP